MIVDTATDLPAPTEVLAARTAEESGGGGGGKQTAHVQSGPTGGQFTSGTTSKSTPTKPAVRKPAPKRSLPGSQVTPIAKKRQTLSRKGPNDPEQVKQLQALLKELKISGLAVDGDFGGDTEAAVKAVQEKLGLKPTGRCSASLLGTLEKVHALSPCVVRASSQVLAAAGPVGYDEDEVTDKVEVAPGTWVCAHADGTVSMRMASDAAREWAEAVVEMADEAGQDEGDEPDAEEAGEYVTAAAEEPVGEPVEAAAGKDVTPGHDQLHHYWTQDPEGLSKWIDSPTPWTTLVAHLTRHVGPEKAKIFASKWLHEVTGMWAGSDAHRVAHGGKPRGKVIGPG